MVTEAKVVYCKCGCRQIIMAAVMPTKEDDEYYFAQYEREGHLVEVVTSERVKVDFCTHGFPSENQLELFTEAQASK